MRHAEKMVAQTKSDKMKMYRFETDKYPRDFGDGEPAEISSKCPNCNWENTYIYAMADSEKEAIELVKNGEAGICGNCIGDLLVDAGYNIFG